VIFDGSVHEFLFGAPPQKIVPNGFTSSNFLLKNSSIVKQFCQLFSGSGIIIRRMYSSLKSILPMVQYQLKQLPEK
jgi:adenine-specific DNA methylase